MSNTTSKRRPNTRTLVCALAVLLVTMALVPAVAAASPLPIKLPPALSIYWD